ncbi:MAG: nuclear transport factor 2 family protein [Verrucomicrobiota bacterium]
MLASLLLHPLSTFFAGLILAVAVIALLLVSCAAPNTSETDVAIYQKRLAAIPPSGLDPGSAAEKAALDRFTSFLQGIGDVAYVRENASKAYANDAWLDDTLVVHRGAAEIEKYFVQTSETMTFYQVFIEDISRSGDNYYIRWTMVFAAPALSGGKSVHSVGISQVRFDRGGKVVMHKDFWDSGQNFYAHLPLIGGAVGYVKKRMEKN